MGRLGLPHAGAWLEAVPITALGLYLQPSEFVPATRYRLGCKVYDSMTELDPALHASATVMHWETMQCVVATREKESPGTMPSGMQSTTPITRSNSAGCCTAVTAGHALSARFNTKMASAAVACQAEGTTIIPLVFRSPDATLEEGTF